MTQRTPLHATHVAARRPHGRFRRLGHAGELRLQIEEHHAVRRDAGMFDVSHMLALDLIGSGAKTFLRGLIANDVAKLTETGQGALQLHAQPEGGVIDDLIVYFPPTPNTGWSSMPAPPTRMWPGCSERLAATGLAARLTPAAIWR